MALPSARDRVIGRTAFALGSGGLCALLSPSAGLSVLLVGLVALPLVALEVWAERRSEALADVIAAATAAWLVTAAGLAIADLQFAYTNELFKGGGTAGALTAVGQELAFMVSRDEPRKPSPVMLLFTGTVLATASSFTFAVRTSKSPILATAAVFGVGCMLTSVLLFTRWLAFGGDPGLALTFVAISIPTSLMAFAVAGGWVVVLLIEDFLGQALGALATRLRERFLTGPMAPR